MSTQPLLDEEDVYRPASPLALSELAGEAPYRVPVHLSDAAREWAEGQTGLQVLDDRRGPTYGHGRLWFGRDYLTRVLVRHLWSRHRNLLDGDLPIRDIGSNLEVMAEKVWPLPVWGVMPNILPEDSKRWRRVADYPNKCPHSLQECDCPRSDVDVSVNTLYYISAADLADSLEGGRSHYAIIFCNESFYGSFHEEAAWEHNEAGQVICRVFGDNIYYHPRQSYLYQSSTCVSPGRHLVREVLCRIDGHMLVCFTLSDAPGLQEPPRPNWADIATRNSVQDGVVFKKVQGAQTELDPLVHELAIDQMTIVSDAVVLTRSGRLPIVICRAVLCNLALYANGRERTPALKQDLDFQSAQAYRRMNMPPEMVPRAATATAVLAMHYNLILEMQSLGALQRRWGATMGFYSRLLSWSWVCRLPLWAASIVTTVVVIMVALAMALLWWYDPTPYRAATASLAGVVALLTVFVAVSFYCRNRLIMARQREWDTATREGAVMTYEGPVSGGLTRQTTFKPAPPQKPDARLVITGVERGKPWQNKELARAEGVVFDRHTPVVFGTGQAEEEVGLRGRVLKRAPERDWIVWEDFASWSLGRSSWGSSSSWYPAEPVPQPSWRGEAYWMSWLASTKYSLRVREGFRKVWEAIHELDVWDPVWNTCKSFVKFEFGVGKRTFDGTEEGTPRIIQGCQPQAVVVMGPTVKWVAAWASATLDGKPPELGSSKDPNMALRTFWAPGRTAEEIGGWARDAEDAIPDGFWLELDYDRFDSTYRKADRNVDTQWLEEVVQPDHFVLDCFNGQHPAGKTYGGLTYSTEDGVCSGEGLTTFVGTKKNAENAEYAIQRINHAVLSLGLVRLRPEPGGGWGLPAGPIPPVRYAIMAGGDDGLMRLSGRPEEVVPKILDVFRALGFKVTAKYSFNIAEVTFYSKLFWPVADGCRYVLGPKPGRLLSKVGWSLSSPDKTNLRGTFVSLGQDAGHVPFVKEYVATVSPLLKGQKARYGSDHRFRPHASAKHEIHPERTWQFVRDRYGLGPEDCEKFKSELARAPSTPFVISSEVMNKLAEVDVEENGTCLGRMRTWV